MNAGWRCLDIAVPCSLLEFASAMKLLTVAEVADRLAVSRSLIYELVASGELPYVPVGKSKAYRFDPDDITAYIHRRKVQNEGRKSVTPRPRLKHIKL